MRKTIHFQHYCAPCGEITLASIGDELCLCDWRESPRAERNRRRLIRHLDAALTEATSEVLENAKRQLDEYFLAFARLSTSRHTLSAQRFNSKYGGRCARYHTARRAPTKTLPSASTTPKAQEPWHKPLAPTASASSFPATASSGPTIP